MPLHLAPLSRRRFLGGSAVLALSPLVPRNGRAADSETWALLSDTHIAADRDFVSRQGTHMASNLERVVAELLSEKDQLSGVIISGDCAFNEGLAGDYETFLSLLAPLREAGLPLHFLMGNHDNRDTFAGVLGQSAGNAAVEGKRCSVIEGPLANWILLDSLRQVNQVEGELGAAQLDWIDRLLRDHPDKPAILVGHHYLQAPSPAGETTRVTGLVDTEAFQGLFETRPSAKAFIFGHSHNWNYSQSEKGLHLVNLPPTSYVFKETLPNGWVRATLSSSGLQLELRTLDPAHSKQGQRLQLDWR